jgi:predicted phage terminase large subunit-like protein
MRIPYAFDESGHGFFWVESKQKLEEALSVRRNAPAEFEAVYQGRPGLREGSIFLEDDLNAFFDVPFPLDEFAIGMGSPFVAEFVKRGHAIGQAWDTAFSTSSQAAHSVCVTGLFIPCNDYHRGENPELVGQCDYHFDVLILNVFRRKLDWGALVGAVKTQYYLWRPFEVVIEKKASGQSLIQNFNSSSIPIIGVGATDSKGDRALNSVGIKSAGSVQGWFRQHRVRTPRWAPWLEKWKAEMKDFSGADDSSSDQVDATVHLVTRAIMMGATMAVLPTDWKPEYSAIANAYSDAGKPDLSMISDPRAAMIMAFDMLPSLVEDPYQGTCSRCAHDGANFCKIMGRRMLAVDSCPSFIDKGLDVDESDASTGIESALRWI